MPTPHVFVVNERTFPLHLRYRFAGTTPGSGSKVERHIRLLADIARTRPGDPVLFYLQGHGFYGIFRIAEEPSYPFWEPPDGYLQKELGLPLIYRVRICPFEVYPRPITEWEAIDRLPVYSRDIRWSLLYRKLRGERGCSYLFPHEFESMRALFQAANPEGPLCDENENSCLDWENGQIRVDRGTPAPPYTGQLKPPLDHIQVRQGETHLQAWLTWHIGRDRQLDDLVGQPCWFANEVYAGTGMQRMDLMTIERENSYRRFRIIELKTTRTEKGEVEQIRRYIWWVREYVANQEDRIRPIWISKGFSEGAIEALQKIAKEENCEPPEIWNWEPRGNRPLFERLK
jgi:hypothetical protein